MQSLKDAGYVIARVLGDVSPLTVYEKARILGRAGMLEQGSAKGPGGGIRATPHNVALLLLAQLTASGEGDTEGRVKEFSALKGECGLTGKRTLGKALAAILAMKKLPDEVWLQIELKTRQAVITYSDAEAKEGFSHSSFGKATPKVGLQTTLHLYEGLHQIAETVGGKK